MDSNSQGLGLQLLVLDGVISRLPEEEQGQVRECQEKIIGLVSEYGDMGTVAFSRAAVEMALEEGV